MWTTAPARSTGSTSATGEPATISSSRWMLRAQLRGIRRGPDNPRERQKSHRLSHDAVGELRDGNVDLGLGSALRVASRMSPTMPTIRRVGSRCELRPQPPPDQKTVGEWISIRPESSGHRPIDDRDGSRAVLLSAVNQRPRTIGILSASK